MCINIYLHASTSIRGIIIIQGISKLLNLFVNVKYINRLDINTFLIRLCPLLAIYSNTYSKDTLV